MVTIAVIIILIIIISVMTILIMTILVVIVISVMTVIFIELFVFAADDIKLIPGDDHRIRIPKRRYHDEIPVRID